MSSVEALRADYRIWHWCQVSSGDIDPVYPVLGYLSDVWGLRHEERAWLVFLHVAFYHPGSTLAAFALWPEPGDIPDALLSLPCGTERRGHRAKPALLKHLAALRDTFKYVSPRDWVDGHDWTGLNERLTTIPGNGRWAAYKTAEMLQKVCGLPITAADAGHQFSSGPRHGLELLEPGCPRGNTKGDVAELDRLTQYWADVLGESDLAQIETTLCDFDSMVKGRYYTGHDIDAMQAAFTDPRVCCSINIDAWNARAESFDSRFLGELNGWIGVRKELNTRYKETGEYL